jgi:hypothetical protein
MYAGKGKFVRSRQGARSMSGPKKATDRPPLAGPARRPLCDWGIGEQEATELTEADAWRECAVGTLSSGVAASGIDVTVRG